MDVLVPLMRFPIGVTSINENEFNEFKVFPNPTGDIVFLQIPSKFGDNCVVEIYDPTGKQINVHNMNQKNYEVQWSIYLDIAIFIN